MQNKNNIKIFKRRKSFRDFFVNFFLKTFPFYIIYYIIDMLKLCQIVNILKDFSDIINA